MPITSPKQAARRLMEQLDDDVSFEEIHYRLYVVQQIERGLQDVEEGRTVTREEGKARLGRWLGHAPEQDA